MWPSGTAAHVARLPHWRLSPERWGWNAPVRNRWCGLLAIQMALALALLLLEVSRDGRPVASLAQCPVDEPLCCFEPVFTA